MKSNFARCAKQLEDRKKAVGFDPKTVGNIFSSKAANQVFTACHSVPQTYQTTKQSFNGGVEDYVVRAARAKTCNRQTRNYRDDLLWMVYGMSLMSNFGTPKQEM